MKKFISVLLVCLLAFSLAACGSEKADAEEEKTTADTSLIQQDEEATEDTTEAAPSLTETEAAELYNKAYIVAKDWFSFYSPYCISGDYFTVEENMLIYYAIGHESVNSLETLKALLYENFSVAFTDYMVSESYIEQDGRLYQQCRMAGDMLPTYYLDETKAVLSAESEGRASFEITLVGRYDESLMDDGFTDANKTQTVDFVFENGRWVIDNSFTRALYPNYEWKGISSADEG